MGLLVGVWLGLWWGLGVVLFLVVVNVVVKKVVWIFELFMLGGFLVSFVLSSVGIGLGLFDMLCGGLMVVGVVLFVCGVYWWIYWWCNK